MTGRWALISALACVAASLVAASCGSDGDGESTTSNRFTNPNLVTNELIGRYPRKSPQRAILLWFQAVQFRDQDAVRSTTTDREVARVSRKTLDDAVSLIGAALGKPRLVSTRERGKEAAVRLFIQSYVPNRAEPVGETPRTFSLLKVGGKWKVDDVSYLVAARAGILAQTPESD